MTKEEANAIAQRIIEEEESNRIFWEECKQFEEEIIKTPVEDLAKSVRKAVLRTKGNYDDEYVVSKWWDRRYWYNFMGWCGPHSLAFISAVDGQYWGANVSGLTPGSEWFMRRIYQKVLEKVGEGAKAPWDLKGALEKNTTFFFFTGYIFILWYLLAVCQR